MEILAILCLLVTAKWGAVSATAENEACTEKDDPSCHPVEGPIWGPDEGDFTRLTLKELQDVKLTPITWRDTKEWVTDNAFEVAVPESLTRTLLEYADGLGITQIFRELTVGGRPLPENSEKFVPLGSEDYPMQWYIQRPESHWNSNMHWISPADGAAHEDFLRALGDGGMDEVLEAIGETLELDGLVCYQLTFIGVSQCDEGYVHTDFNGVDGKAFNVIIPLILATDSPPELWVAEEKYKGRYKYRLGAATAIGDEAWHGTAEVDYQNEFRMAATIYIADVDEDNAEDILSEYTQYYPPRDPEMLTSQAGIHWGKGKLPRGAQILKKNNQQVVVEQ